MLRFINTHYNFLVYNIDVKIVVNKCIINKKSNSDKEAKNDKTYIRYLVSYILLIHVLYNLVRKNMTS